MSFKVGERIAVNNILGPVQDDGQPVEVLCDVTLVTKAHVIAKLISVSKGFAFAVKADGNHEIVKASHPSKGSAVLQAGDVTALPFADIVPATKLSEPKREHEGLTRDEVKKKLKFTDELIDKYIRQKMLTPYPDGSFSGYEVGVIKTVSDNVEREQVLFGDEAKELRRLQDRQLAVLSRR